MRRITIFFALMVFVAANLYSQPKIEILGGDTYNWGQVKPKDSPLKAKVVVKNTGNQPLYINEVKPACGCTSAPLYKNELNPGDTTMLNITLNVGGYTGPTTKTVNIKSNDTASPNKILVLKADIVRDIYFLPTQYFDFKKMKVGFEGEAKLSIKNKWNKDLILNNIQTSPESIRLNFANKLVIKPEEEIEIIAKIVPEKKGSFSCQIKMKTNHPDYEELTIQGYGTVEEPPVFNDK